MTNNSSNFLWGATMAPYQIEGVENEDANRDTEWGGIDATL